MKRGNHTFGPWNVNSTKLPVTIESDHGVIAEVVNVPFVGSGSQKANATLLAAAPKLLAALERVVSLAAPILAPAADVVCSSGEIAIHKARIAIAEAKG
jgi:hypothetical protein